MCKIQIRMLTLLKIKREKNYKYTAKYILLIYELLEFVIFFDD